MIPVPPLTIAELKERYGYYNIEQIYRTNKKFIYFRINDHIRIKSNSKFAMPKRKKYIIREDYPIHWNLVCFPNKKIYQNEAEDIKVELFKNKSAQEIVEINKLMCSIEYPHIHDIEIIQYI
jgi:hypothetical protein